METLTHWIAGESVESTSGRFFPVYNPATGEQIARTALATAEEVDRVVAVATEAAAAWRATSLSRRTQVMFRFRDLVDANRDLLAETLTREHGKVLSDSMGEINRGLENIEYACGVPQLLKGEYSEQAATSLDVYSIR
ncbi:MAG TPA: aldehyde dehydrogenase family protein, partial [Acidimicrobiales bacterium]|nr:aldehyde dehydrogenase family protein [Acidimicrobiales bacterium]